MLPIQKDDDQQIEGETHRLLERIHLPANFIGEFLEMFMEVCNNVYFHSGLEENTGWGYMHIQVYPKIQKIRMAVCDLGVGVLGSYERTGQVKGRTEAQLVQEVFNLMESSLNNENYKIRGRGLDTVKQFIESFGGHLRFETGLSKYTLEDEKPSQYEALTSPFYGTMVDIELNYEQFTP